MKHIKIWNLLFYITILCVILNRVRAQDDEKENTGGDVVANPEDKNINPDNTTNNNTDNISNNNNNNNNNKNSNNNNSNKNKEEEEEEEDDRECGLSSSETGSIIFIKPNSKSIVVPYSNFTIIWYYDDRTYAVRYPSRNITLMLFNNEDANYNDPNSWKNPVYSITIPISQIEPGPERDDGKPVYQWNWDTNFYINEGYSQIPTLNAKYKFRIIGDGRDTTINAKNYPCYKDGDLQPGSTSPFFIVQNSALGLNYKPLVIESSGFSILKSTKLLTTIIISVVVSLLVLL